MSTDRQGRELPGFHISAAWSVLPDSVSPDLNSGTPPAHDSPARGTVYLILRAGYTFMTWRWQINDRGESK